MLKDNFYTAYTILNELYGLELEDDVFETYGMLAYNKIGNKDYKMKVLHAHPVHDPCGGWYVCKPCDLEAIEAITLPFEDFKETSSTENYPGVWELPVEQEIEWNNRMPNELYISGKYVKYKELGDRIYFTEPFPVIFILYKTKYTDENGLPFLTEKEATAVAAYCAYAHYFKQGLLTKDSSTVQLATVLKADWLKACSQARVPAEISQNDVNEILDTAASFDRHNFGRTNKPIK